MLFLHKVCYRMGVIKSLGAHENQLTMGKTKKNLDDLKKDMKTIEKKDMDKISGGKKGKNKKYNGCGGIVPQ